MSFSSKLPVVLVALMLLSGFVPAYASAPALAVSYNPAGASAYHAPLSGMGLLAVTHSYRIASGQPLPQGSSLPIAPPQSVPTTLTRFINDSSYMPQSETTIAVDPVNPARVVGGFNDGRYFFCPFLRSIDCPDGYTASVSGFSTSTDGGATVSKSNDLPGISIGETNLTSHTTAPGFLLSWGDPSLAASPDGTFYYSTLAIDPETGANGIMVAKSNANLWNSGNACATPLNNPSSNSCWTNALVYANLTYQCPAPGICGTTSFEDKDAIAIDTAAGSPFNGDVYIAWNHFFTSGTSALYAARCTPALVCTMISGGPAPLASSSDPFVDFATPAVGPDGTVYVSWCNFGTISTYGPVTCSVRSSPPGGGSFGTIHKIMSFMGVGSDLAGDSALIGFATEQFRTSSVLTFAVDDSAGSSSAYFAIALCTFGTYYVFQGALSLPADNPGNCGTSAVFFTRSIDKGVNWSSPDQVSGNAVVLQPTLSVDPTNGVVVLAYYSSEFDSFNHRLDVVASISKDGGQTFSDTRMTPVSNEPNAEPSQFDYIAQFGGAFVVPQYGDYMTATAFGGKVWVLFTGNYASEQGTLQADPFLARSGETPASLSLGANSRTASPGASIHYSASGFGQGTSYEVSMNWDGFKVSLANGTVQAGGTFSGNFTVPNVESRVYSVVAEDSAGSGATASLGVGQVSLSGVQAALASLQTAVGGVSQAVGSLQSSVSGQLSSLNSSLAGSVGGARTQILSSISALDGRLSTALSGPASTLQLVEYLVILVASLVIVVMGLVILKGRRGSEANPASVPPTPSSP